MHLIFYRGSDRSARAIHVSAGLLASIGAGLLTITGIIAFAAAGLADRPDTDRPVAELETLKETLGAERREVAALKQAAQRQIDALTLRMGQLNANVIRLNALGQRLTGMAGIEEGEFDFANAPALGGPEEPAVAPAAGQMPDLIAEIDALDEKLYDQEQQLTTLQSLMVRRKLQQRVYPQGRPVKAGYISSYFGNRADPFNGKTTYHRGVDFAGKHGTQVVSVAAGVVTWSGDRYGYGNLVEINHGNGYVTRYAHNDRNLVAVGDRVQPGQTIALMGATGRATGPNLHFEVWYKGRPVNPVKHIRQTT